MGLILKYRGVGGESIGAKNEPIKYNDPSNSEQTSPKEKEPKTPHPHQLGRGSDQKKQKNSKQNKK